VEGVVKRIDLLSVAAVVIAGGAIAFDIRRQAVGGVPGGISYYLVAAGALFLAHLALRAPDITGAIGGRQMRHGGNAVLLVVAVVAILGAVNLFVVKHSQNWDLTKTKRFSMSEETRNVLKALKEDVKITYFHNKAAMENGRVRLDMYESLSSHVKVEYVDPLADPMKADQYDARGSTWPIIILDRGTRRERITNDSEIDLTSAIIKLTHDTKKTICFVEGEGERDIDDSGVQGLSSVKTALSGANYDTLKVTLMRDAKVPAACTVLLVTGPSADLGTAVIDGIRTYIKGGGKAYVMLDPEGKASYPNLTGLLKEWNIEAGNNIILDPSSLAANLSPLTPVVGNYPYHDVTRDFHAFTVFHVARTMKAGSATIDGVTAQNLAQTSRDAVGKADVQLHNPQVLEAMDTRGPLSIAAAASLRDPYVKAPAPASAENHQAPEGRVIAVGDSDFINNQVLPRGPGNLDFFLNGVAWLAQDSELISIRPVPPDQNRIFLTGWQPRILLAVTLVFLPGIFVVGGVVGWWQRRRG
jgi:ABC-type uncharacterized transport system involved in gliding motility auxiliary subunit